MSRLILFVCTGNICRSPLAEGIARVKFEQAANRGEAAVELEFASCGTYARSGLPATPQAQQVAEEIGADLRWHESASWHGALLEEADEISCMTGFHVASLEASVGGRRSNVKLLDPGGADIPDPYGLDVAAYRLVRDGISAAVDARMREWLSPDYWS